MIWSPTFNRHTGMTSLNWFLTPLLITAAVACARSGTPTPTHVGEEPKADPSTNVTLKSASDPNRSASPLDLGHNDAEALNKPINDCELPQCIGDAPEALVNAIRTRATQARACYERALKSTPKIAGRLVILMRVTHEGKSCPLHVTTNELADSDSLLPCVRAVMEQESYPRASQGCVDLQLPLRFVPEFIEADAGAASSS
jgi:hypothetical protein